MFYTFICCYIFLEYDQPFDYPTAFTLVYFRIMFTQTYNLLIHFLFTKFILFFIYYFELISQYTLFCRIVCCITGLCSIYSRLRTSYAGLYAAFWKLLLLLCQCFIILYAATFSWNIICLSIIQLLSNWIIFHICFPRLNICSFTCLLIHIVVDIIFGTNKLIPRFLLNSMLLYRTV